jgi:hypothetical protein
MSEEIHNRLGHKDSSNWWVWKNACREEGREAARMAGGGECVHILFLPLVYSKIPNRN